MNSARAQWMAIIGGFLVLVLVGVVLGAIVGTVQQGSSSVEEEGAEQASSSEAETEEPAEELTEEEPTREEAVDEDSESFEDYEARKKREIAEARTPEERVRAIVEYMPQFEQGEPDDPRRVWVSFYNDNGCLDVLVKYRTTGPLFGLRTQAETTEDEMKRVYESIHSDREAHEAVCDVTVAAFGDPEDDYGQKTDENIYQTTITPDKASRVNWSSTGDVNFYVVWRVDLIHPGVREEEEDENDRTVLDCVHDPDLLEAIGEDCSAVAVA